MEVCISPSVVLCGVAGGVCVCVRARVCVRVCVRARVCVRVCVRVCMCAAMCTTADGSELF